MLLFAVVVDRELYAAPIVVLCVTPGSVNALVVTSRLPVPTSTLALVWSEIGNGNVVAEVRCPVTFVDTGPPGSQL